MLPTKSHFDSTLKKTLLQNALTPVKEFMDIKHQETLDLARGRDKLDFEAYVKVASNVAAQITKQHGSQSSRRYTKMHQLIANRHDFYDGFESEVFDMAYEENYDEQPGELYEVFESNQERYNRPFM